jgi:hypothetical protein
LIASDTLKTDSVFINPISTLAATTAISSPTGTTAVSGGNVTAALNDSVIAKGVVWSTSSNPTVNLATKTVNGSGLGSFTSNITGLNPATLYYVKSYATNSNGTDYGTQISFTTPSVPVLDATTAATSITFTSALIGGNVTIDNGYAVTDRGFVWSTTPDPTTSNTKVPVAGTTGAFTATITGLTNTTLYYVRSYAINSQGTNYGDQISFSTAVPPAGSGLSSGTAGTSAYSIKVAFPSSTDGFYWIRQPGVNSGNAYQIYADMTTTDGTFAGGWTLIMKNSSHTPEWTSASALLLNNTTNPYATYADVISTSTVNYSIIQWADSIKRNNSSAPYFQYMIDANTRGRYGGIFNANVNYSFISPLNTNTNVALAKIFGTWTYDDSSIEQRMPYYTSAAGGGLITTSSSYSGNWWGTLISNSGFVPAPWIGNVGGTEGLMTDPGIIWYWVR